MSGVGPSLAVGPCWVCGRRFLFDPDDVATVYIDRIRGEPPDPDDDNALARSRRMQVCYRCAKSVAEERLQHGLDDFWNGQWGNPDGK